MKLTNEQLQEKIKSWVTPEIIEWMKEQFDPQPNLDGMTWDLDTEGVELISFHYPNDLEENLPIQSEDHIDEWGEFFEPMNHQCFQRIAYPKVSDDTEGVEHAFRLEIYTSPEDDRVISWALIVD